MAVLLQTCCDCCFVCTMTMLQQLIQNHFYLDTSDSCSINVYHVFQPLSKSWNFLWLWLLILYDCVTSVTFHQTNRKTNRINTECFFSSINLWSPDFVAYRVLIIHNKGYASTLCYSTAQYCCCHDFASLRKNCLLAIIWSMTKFVQPSPLSKTSDVPNQELRDAR